MYFNVSITITVLMLAYYLLIFKICCFVVRYKFVGLRFVLLQVLLLKHRSYLSK